MQCVYAVNPIPFANPNQMKPHRRQWTHTLACRCYKCRIGLTLPQIAAGMEIRSTNLRRINYVCKIQMQIYMYRAVLENTRDSIIAQHTLYRCKIKVQNWIWAIYARGHHQQRAKANWIEFFVRLCKQHQHSTQPIHTRERISVRHRAEWGRLGNRLLRLIRTYSNNALRINPIQFVGGGYIRVCVGLMCTGAWGFSTGKFKLSHIYGTL